MAGRKHKLALAASLLAVAVILAASFLTVRSAGYALIVNHNWGTRLPLWGGTVARYSETSFHGDGYRYAVLDMSRSMDAAYFDGWDDRLDDGRPFADVINAPDVTYRDLIADVLAYYGVPDEHMPDINTSGRYFIAHGDQSRHEYVIMILDPETGLLYVIESFM